MGHIKSMGRDIAFLKRFGPNPEFTHRYIKDKIRIEGIKNRDIKRKAKIKLSEENRIPLFNYKLDSYFAYFKGQLNVPSNTFFAHSGDYNNSFAFSSSVSSIRPSS